jgi:hypothetical protein
MSWQVMAMGAGSSRSHELSSRRAGSRPAVSPNGRNYSRDKPQALGSMICKPREVTEAMLYLE